MSDESPIEQRDNLFRGEDKALRFTIVDSAGAAVDVTGWTLQFDLFRRPNEPTALVTKATGGSGITLTTPASGIVTVTLDRADTQYLPGGVYFYTLRRTNSGSAAVLAHGTAALRDPYA